jgi:hypothetical protein
MNQYLLQIEGSWYSPTPGLSLNCLVKSNLLPLLIPGPFCLFGEKSETFFGSI